MYIKRRIQDSIQNSLFKGKIVVVYGARQVGKTTLVKEVAKQFGDFNYFSCDEPDVTAALTNRTSTQMIDFLGSKKLIILDEAQRVTNIGVALKLLVDNYPDRQFIATGSSSFDLANHINEPLTGRKRVFHLHPLSVVELAAQSSKLEETRTLEQRLIYGLYPEVVFTKDDSATALKEIVSSYLYKDILRFEDIRNMDVVSDLLRALALQVGNEVSYTELGNLLGIDKKTVTKYVHLLEQAFVIFRVRPWHKNKRKELSKLRKIYFYDNGVRNALINNLNPLNMRNDVGNLWENFIMSEKIKSLSASAKDYTPHFWRTYDKQEVDLILEISGELSAFEFKWSEKVSPKTPTALLELYPNISYRVINRENFWSFLD